MTSAEQLLWQALRDRQLGGLKFRSVPRAECPSPELCSDDVPKNVKLLAAC